MDERNTGPAAEAACCCNAASCCDFRARAATWRAGSVDTDAGAVPAVTGELSFSDRLGSLKARLGIRRMDYTVPPGLYALGTPDEGSPVLVTANYKMSFDCLRSAMRGRDAWLLVLDTRGINVWCAAGKGTFGTDELVARVESADLPEVVDHGTLILPQLGAPGVAAHEVQQRTGFRVVYGPIRAEDLPEFLDNGLEATDRMRLVTFSLPERLVLTPMELVGGAKYGLPAAAVLGAAAGFGPDGYSVARAMSDGARAAGLVVVGLLGGAVLAPALLPVLPGRAFSLKGVYVGLVLGLCHLALRWGALQGTAGALDAAAWLLLLPALCSFLAMNFTGATPYTSLSGVRKEMALAVPLQAVAALVGLGLWIAGRLV
ncbi:MAG: mercury methylation corrinoid protein HgcA [Candidatus Brocadiia bacterium]